MANKYTCDRCGKLLTDKEYKKSESSVTGFRDFCKSCLKDWIKFSSKQEKEYIEFMNFAKTRNSEGGENGKK